MRPRQELLQRLRDHGGQRPPRRGGMGTDPRDERHRQLDGEHRGRGGHRNMSGPAGALHVAVRLPGRTAEPAGQLSRGVGCRHPRVQQVRGGVDPLGEHVTASASATGRPTNRHVTNILLDMSHRRTDTPRQFDTRIAQRHLKAEVANCVGGVLSPLLANVALSVLDEHFAEAPGGPRSTTKQRWTRRQKGLPNYRLFRYADFVILVSGTRSQTEALLPEVASVLSTVGLRLSVDKTLITHIDEGLDFLGWRIQRHQKRGTDRHYVYNYPAKKALRSIKAKCKTICRMNVSLPLAVLLHQLNSVLRGWTAYFRVWPPGHSNTCG